MMKPLDIVTPTLHGRVFNRLQQFHTLPQALKDEVASLEAHITTIQTEVFAKHHTLQLKSMRGVRYKQLSEKVYDWVVKKEASPADPAALSNGSIPQPDTAATGAYMADTSGLCASAAIPIAPTVAVSSPTMTDEESIRSDEEADAKRAAEDATTSARQAHAKRLIDAMVIKGFITPNKEVKSTIPMTTEEFEFNDSDLLVPLATAITGLTIPTTTVWDLVDGAVFAELLKRRAGLLAPLTQGKDVYVVVNARARSITLFESDVAREPIAIYEAALTHVTFDESHYENGIKIWCESDSELLNLASVEERDALTMALEAIGATYQEHGPRKDDYVTNVMTCHTFTFDEATPASPDNMAETVKPHAPSSSGSPVNEQLHGYATAKLQTEQVAVAETTPQTSEPPSETTPTHRESYMAETCTPNNSFDVPASTATHGETVAASPPAETDTANHFGVPDDKAKKEEEEMRQQKTDKILRFEEPQPTTTTLEGSPTKSSCFGHWITSNANTNHIDTTNNTNANRTNSTNANADVAP